MIQTEKLKRIKLRCQQLLASDFRPDTGLPGGLPSVTHALAESTFADCEFIEAYRKIKFGWDGDCGATRLVDELEDRTLAAWPEELL